MKAIVKNIQAPGLELVNIDVPAIQEHDVLIKISKAAICGTDLHIDKYDAWASQFLRLPVTVGHEFVGIVHQVGSKVTRFSPGDRVSAEGHITCGHCYNCLTGNPYLCPHTLGTGSQTNGIYAEFASFPEKNVWPVPSNIPDDVAACLDPLGNSVHTALSFNITAQDVLITGAGPIGCMAAAVAKKAGARSVTITDISDYRLSLAKQLGADHTINISKTPLKTAMQDLDLIDAFGIGLEMSGSPQAFASMIDALRCGGNIAILGIIPDNTPVDWTKIIFKSLNLRGIYGRKIFETWYQTTGLLQSGLNISPIITHHFHFTEFRKAFDLAHSGQSGKIILNFD